MNCPNCKKPITEGSTFCGGCGLNLTLAKETPPHAANPPTIPTWQAPQPPPPNTRQKSPVIAILLVLMLGLGGGAGGYLAWDFLFNQPTTPNNPPTEPAALSQQPNPTTQPTTAIAQEPTGSTEPTEQEPASEPAEPESVIEPAAPAAQPTPPPTTAQIPNFPGLLEHGSQNEAAVEMLQTALNEISQFYTDIRTIDVESGNFGSQTRGAVLEFQNRLGLPTTGIVDQPTWNSIMQQRANPPTVPEPPHIPPTNVRYITLSNLHLRASPSTDAESLNIISADSVVLVTEQVGARWFRVETSFSQGGQIGYMYAAFLIREDVVR
ncbi:MAG: peptidoglycan-binding protein [Defluviitaleaceae bacterium]|nr:peptidoglycan-binding protein [Defluviitaleaceae bacterium]